MNPELSQLYRDANRLLEHAMAAEFKQVRSKMGFELEQRVILREKMGKDGQLVDDEVEHIQQAVQQLQVDGSRPFARFYRDWIGLEKYEVTTLPLPSAEAIEAVEWYKEKSHDWLKAISPAIDSSSFEPVYRSSWEVQPSPQSLTLHANVHLERDGQALHDKAFPPAITLMMAEALRQNAVLLIGDAKTFVGHHRKTFSCSPLPEDPRLDGKNFNTVLCERKSESNNNGLYLEVRCADAQADPAALAMVTHLGMYLGLKHPKAKSTNHEQRLPAKPSILVHWFKEGTLLRDTLDRLSRRYGSELGISRQLGSDIYKAVMDEHGHQAPTTFTEISKIDMEPVATFGGIRALLHTLGNRPAT